MRWFLVFWLFAGALSAQNNMLYRQRPAVADAQLYEIEQKYIANPDAIETGKELYLLSCSGCHGPHGEGGRGPSLVRSRNMRRKNHKELFEVIKKGLPGTDMPPFPLPDDQLWKLTAFVRNLSAPAFDTKVPGDAKAGETLFFGKAGCSGCHMVRGRGGFLGPDLSNAGLSNYNTQLREGLLDPNVRLSEGFQPVRVVTQSGKTIEGVAKNHTNYSIQIVDKEGGVHTLRSTDVQALTFPEKTWMPDDYKDRLSNEEVDNILAFLSRQVTRIPSATFSEEEEEE